jgi:hypothetical protein
LRLTFVTLVPARKNTPRRTKGRLHGCTAWATAVKAATIMPAGVRELCDQALYTSANVAGAANMAFMAILETSDVEEHKLPKAPT